MNESIRIRSRSLSAWDQRTGHEPRVVALRAGVVQTLIRLAVVRDVWPSFQTNDSSYSSAFPVGPVDEECSERRTLNCSTATIPFSPEEMQLLDALDSELERQGGDGVWGTDQYGIHTTGTSSSNTSSLGVVCVYHPQITTDSVLRGGDDLDDETEERLNAALWKYSEHVATLIETQLNEFVHQN